MRGSRNFRQVGPTFWKKIVEQKKKNDKKGRRRVLQYLFCISMVEI